MGLPGLKSRRQQGYIHSGGSRGESVSLPFPASVSLHPSAHSFSFIFKASSECLQISSVSLIASLPLVFTPFPPSKDSVITLGAPGSPPDLKILNSILSARPLAWNVICTYRHWRLGCRHLWWGEGALSCPPRCPMISFPCVPGLKPVA